MAQENNHRNPRDISTKFFQLFLQDETIQSERKTWDRAPEGAYSIYYELLNQIHNTTDEFILEIKKGGLISREEQKVYPFHILNKDILPSGDQEEILDAVDFLSEYDRKWHSMSNIEGDEIIAKQGVIITPKVGPRSILLYLSVYRIKIMLQTPLSDSFFK